MAEFKFSKTRTYELLNAAEVLDGFAEIPQKPDSEGQLLAREFPALIVIKDDSRSSCHPPEIALT